MTWVIPVQDRRRNAATVVGIPRPAVRRPYFPNAVVWIPAIPPIFKVLAIRGADDGMTTHVEPRWLAGDRTIDIRDRDSVKPDKVGAEIGRGQDSIRGVGDGDPSRGRV